MVSFQLNGSVQIGVVGVPAGEVIVDTTKKERVDLIVLGARRLGSNLRKSTGTTKGYVIRNVNVPVLVCKHKKAQPSAKKIRGRDVKRLVVAGSDGELHATEALKCKSLKHNLQSPRRCTVMKTFPYDCVNAGYFNICCISEW